jgi:predicted ATPase
MISRLHVENYKCLRDVSVDLGPFTVLIGSNDSGKSSILDAIRVLGRTTRETIAESLAPEDGEKTDSYDSLVWRQDIARQIAISIEGTTGSEKLGYSLVLRTGPGVVEEKLDGGALLGSAEPRYTVFASDLRANRVNVPVLKLLLPAFASSIKYRLDPRALRQVNPFRSEPWLSGSGDNLPEAVDALMTGPDRSAIGHMEEALHAAVPTLGGVLLHTVRQNGAIAKTIGFTLAGPAPLVTIPTAQASEGALFLTAFLVLAYGDSPEILLIEEPENGLHPTRLQTVIDLLRAISTGAVGNRPRQVIMTTHSPLLLNYVKPEEVRIVRRDPEQGTNVTPMTAVPNLDKLLSEFAVGELWYLLTEEGLLKGAHP